MPGHCGRADTPKLKTTQTPSATPTTTDRHARANTAHPVLRLRCDSIPSFASVLDCGLSEQANERPMRERQLGRPLHGPGPPLGAQHAARALRKIRELPVAANGCHCWGAGDPGSRIRTRSIGLRGHVHLTLAGGRRPRTRGVQMHVMATPGIGRRLQRASAGWQICGTGLEELRWRWDLGYAYCCTSTAPSVMKWIARNKLGCLPSGFFLSPSASSSCRVLACSDLPCRIHLSSASKRKAHHDDTWFWCSGAAPNCSLFSWHARERHADGWRRKTTPDNTRTHRPSTPVKTIIVYRTKKIKTKNREERQKPANANPSQNPKGTKPNPPPSMSTQPAPQRSAPHRRPRRC